jgi:hypothetical protein
VDTGRPGAGGEPGLRLAGGTIDEDRDEMVEAKRVAFEEAADGSAEKAELARQTHLGDLVVRMAERALRRRQDPEAA